MSVTAAPPRTTIAPGETRESTRRWRVPALILSVGLVAFAIALPGLRTASWSQFGLMFAGNPLYPASVILCAVAFVVAISTRAVRTAALALCSSVLVMRLPTAVSTDAPLYSWTYKHFGVVDYIQRFGGVRQDIDIYHNWPGAFSLIAWVNTITGSETIVIAQWFAVFSQFALAGAIYFLCRTQHFDTSTSLVAAFIAQACNWVGQDYFSPQSIGVTLAIVVIALMLSSREHPAAAWVAVPIFAGIVVTHQLTPYWILIVVGALTVLGRVRPRYMFLVMAALAVGYAFMHQDVLERFGSLLNLDFLANLETNHERIEATPSTGQIFNSLASRSVSLIVWLSAGSIIVWRLIRRRSEWRSTLTLAAVAFGSGLILVGQSYGGEAIFRVLLYSLPGCAMIIAPVVVAVLHGGRGASARSAKVLIGVVVTATTFLSTQAYYGGWFANLVSRESIEIATGILKEETPGTLTIGVAPGAPGRLVAEYVEFASVSANFDEGVDTWLNAWEGWEGADFGNPEQVDRLTDSMVERGRPVLVVITRQMLYYSDYYGLFPSGVLERFVQALGEDPRWQEEYASAQVIMFRLTPEGEQ